MGSAAAGAADITTAATIANKPTAPIRWVIKRSTRHDVVRAVYCVQPLTVGTSALSPDGSANVSFGVTGHAVHGVDRIAGLRGLA
jgi:hypothetical protein